MSRVKTFDSTGIDPGGKLYAGDLNALQDQYADFYNLLQAIGVGQITVGEAGLIISRFAAGVLGVSGTIRATAKVNAITGLQVNGANLAATHLADFSTLALKTDLAGTFPPGIIVPYAASAAPSGWLIADGSAISRTTYSALFNILNADGLKYGAGDGSTTFNIPDLRGRVPVGKNSVTFNTLGLKAGEETHVLTVTEMPSHTHTGTTGTESATHFHTGTTDGWSSFGYVVYTPDSFNEGTGALLHTLFANYLDGNHTHTFTSNTESANHTHSFTTAATGGNGAHNNLQPYIVTNFIIKT